MKSNNPVFNRSEEFSKSRGYATFDTATAASAGQLEEMYSQPSATPVRTGRMTYDDVVAKTGMTLGVLVITAIVGWFIPGLAIVGAIVGLVLGLVNSFKKEPSPALILLYAAFEGLFVGGISNFFQNYGVNGQPLNGLVAQAVLATVCVFAVTLFAYKSGRIRVTPKFQRGVLIALIGYALFSLVNFVFALFGTGNGWGFRTGGLGIVIGLFAVGLASLCLILDFDMVDKGVKNGLPEKYAWTAAFGLTVTLVWLYVEMLRLIALLRGSN